jgi:hypothetical protein
MKDLYNDGIYPNPLLAHLWLRKIQEIPVVLDKCFSYMYANIRRARPFSFTVKKFIYVSVQKGNNIL